MWFVRQVCRVTTRTIWGQASIIMLWHLTMLHVNASVEYSSVPPKGGDVKEKWCQGLWFHVTRQEFMSVWILVQELRFLIYQVFASEDMEFFGKTEVAWTFTWLVRLRLIDDAPCQCVWGATVLQWPYQARQLCLCPISVFLREDLCWV